jgi:hypothetical protein
MKKSLLTESEIRKFMKFANIGTLTENFIDNNMEEAVTEETVTEEDVVEETLTDETLEEEAVESPADFVQDLVDVIMQHLPGTEISVEKGEEDMGDEPEMDDMGDEPDMDEPMGAESEEADMAPSPEMPGDEAPEPGEMAPDDEEPDMDALMQEVTRRVAARLLKENKK